jgi:hypothetical protein
MKNLIFIYCLLFVLIACNKSDYSSQSITYSDVKKFENLSNQVEESEVFKADLIIREYDNKNIVIYVKPKGRKEAIRAYLIQRNRSKQGMPSEVRNALVTSNPWSVIIKTSGQFLIFRLNNEAGKQVAGRFQETFQEENPIEIIGFGIARFKNVWNWDHIVSKDNEKEAIMGIVSNSPDLSKKYERISKNERAEKCTSGGVGAKSCSISEYFGAVSCSVECTGTDDNGNTLWACCMSSTTTCKCLTEDEIES